MERMKWDFLHSPPSSHHHGGWWWRCILFYSMSWNFDIWIFTHTHSHNVCGSLELLLTHWMSLRRHVCATHKKVNPSFLPFPWPLFEAHSNLTWRDSLSLSLHPKGTLHPPSSFILPDFHGWIILAFVSVCLCECLGSKYPVNAASVFFFFFRFLLSHKDSIITWEDPFQRHLSLSFLPSFFIVKEGRTWFIKEDEHGFSALTHEMLSTSCSIHRERLWHHLFNSSFRRNFASIPFPVCLSFPSFPSLSLCIMFHLLSFFPEQLKTQQSTTSVSSAFSGSHTPTMSHSFLRFFFSYCPSISVCQFSFIHWTQAHTHTRIHVRAIDVWQM